MTIEYQNIHGNRTYKSSLFCMVFEKEEDYASVRCFPKRGRLCGM